MPRSLLRSGLLLVATLTLPPRTADGETLLGQKPLDRRFPASYCPFETRDVDPNQGAFGLYFTATGPQATLHIEARNMSPGLQWNANRIDNIAVTTRSDFEANSGISPGFESCYEDPLPGWPNTGNNAPAYFFGPGGPPPLLDLFDTDPSGDPSRPWDMDRGAYFVAENESTACASLDPKPSSAPREPTTGTDCTGGALGLGLSVLGDVTARTSIPISGLEAGVEYIVAGWWDTNDTLSNPLTITVTVPSPNLEAPPGLFQSWGSPGGGSGQLQFPWGLAVDGSGAIYVADEGNQRIQKFSASGVFLLSWGIPGTGDGQFAGPSGVAVDGAGTVYVADRGNHRVQKFTSQGVFLGKWGTPGPGAGQFDFPSDVAVDSGGNVFVADQGNHRVQKFTSGGIVLALWGSRGSDDGEFYYPTGLGMDSGGNLYVADQSNHRVQKFSGTGAYLAKLGLYDLRFPHDVVVDGAGHVYVADLGNDRIVKYSSSGGFITQWGALDEPIGLALDGANYAYVTELNGHRIRKYGPLSPSTVTLTDMGAGFPILYRSSLAWGDYDQDGDLDLLIAGTDGIGPRTHVYRNDAGVWVDIAAGLAGMEWGTVEWGDVDGDADLDFALAGWNGTPGIARVYRNDSGLFVDGSAGLPGVSFAAVAWGDVDGDGDLDLLLAGLDNSSSPMARVYRNDDGSLVDGGLGLTGVYHADAAWGDVDDDGDLDLVVCGQDGSSGLTRLYRNDGGDLVDSEAGLPGVWEGSLSWGDYESDGDVDLLLTGWTGSMRLCSVYRNDGGVLADIGAGLPGLSSSAASWGDWDNDGDLDIVAAGFDGGGGSTRVYRNDAGTFIDAGAGLPGLYYSGVAWGDVDADGDLDLAVSGSFASGVYRSDGAWPNGAPGAPGNLNAVRLGAEVTFAWTAATDDRTPASGLSYNLRVGTTPGGDEIMPGMADWSTGYRRVPRPGNVQSHSAWTLRLPPGPYYWSVQAMDGAFLGSPFVLATVAVDDPVAAPTALAILPAAPNPFGASTALGYALPRAGRAELAVYDLAGRRVRLLDRGERPAGVRSIRWDGRDDAGSPLGSGVYLIRLETEDGARARKVVLAR